MTTLTARSRWASLRGASLTGVTLAVAAVFAAGCGPANPSSSSSPSSAGASAATAGAPASGSPAAASGAAASPSGPAAAAGPACATTSLKASIDGNGGAAAGSLYAVIDFTNTSDAPCTLYGYPGVSLTTASAAQIGAAAARSAAPAPTLVTLAPGATANAVLRTADPGDYYPDALCHPVLSAYVKIYPPGQAQPVQLPFKTSACLNSLLKLLSVGVVTARAGDGS